MALPFLEFAKQERRAFKPQANNPMDHTFMVYFTPATTSPAFAETLPLLDGTKLEEDTLILTGFIRDESWTQFRTSFVNNEQRTMMKNHVSKVWKLTRHLQCAKCSASSWLQGGLTSKLTGFIQIGTN
mmetsp:Transcript_14263/g.20023  ORF Transcript_14263/g.20023 Transcript_14263/m.20023 type:complete len:128 (-) Transcript_14263:20-403(-)